MANDEIEDVYEDSYQEGFRDGKQIAEGRTQDMRAALIQAIEGAGFSVSGPTDTRAAEHGEPAWVCNARAVLATA
jgi:hypothetical protein